MSHECKLAFFVTSTACYGAIETPGGCITDMHTLGTDSQSVALVPFLQRLIAKAGNPTPTALIAPKGPGSFTNLRVTLATAQGLSIALPTAVCYAPTFFDILLYAMPNQSYAVIDSKRGDYFVKIKENTAHIASFETEILQKSLQVDTLTSPAVESDALILSPEAFLDFQNIHNQWQMIVEPDLFNDRVPHTSYDPIKLLDGLLAADSYMYPCAFEPYYLFDPTFKKSTKPLF
ncbi:MAG: hypothetical protein Q8S21_06580 [Candidatus Paracaedibacteraceae bacterium]|nr:hypothetical protein [Candidatus Paracaedibacteraceae bacterium]